MSTENPGDACLSMGGPLWRRLEAWVRCQFPPAQLRRIDLDQAINDALQQWWRIADAEERENSQASVTSLLGTIFRDRLRDALRFETRGKRDVSLCRHINVDESFKDSSADLEKIDADDIRRMLTIHLSEPECELLRLRERSHSWVEIKKLLGITSSELRSLRKRIETNSQFILRANRNSC